MYVFLRTGVEPFIPVSLKLIDVTATTAEISWDEPLMNKTSDVHYMIYLQHGPGSSNFNNEVSSRDSGVGRVLLQV